MVSVYLIDGFKVCGRVRKEPRSDFGPKGFHSCLLCWLALGNFGSVFLDYGEDPNEKSS